MSAALQARMADLRAERDKAMVDSGNGMAVALRGRMLAVRDQMQSDLGAAMNVDVSEEAQASADGVGLNRPVEYRQEEMNLISNNPRLLH